MFHPAKYKIKYRLKAKTLFVHNIDISMDLYKRGSATI